MNKIKIALSLLASISVIAGCSSDAGTNEKEKASVEVSSTTNSDNSVVAVEEEGNNEVEENIIPEPLRMASEQLKSGNIDRAKTYLDMTVTDFKDTDAGFIAAVLKSTIIATESQSYSYVRRSLGKGIDNIAELLVEEKEVERLKNTLTEDFDKETKLLKDFEESAKYILSNYKGHSDFELTDLNFGTTIRTDSSDLSFFESVGYPIPTKTQMDDTRNYAFEVLLKDNIEGAFTDGKVNYVNYFYLAGLSLMKIEDSSLTKPVMNEVISLTDDDKYNEKRIDVQEYLKEEK